MSHSVFEPTDTWTWSQDRLCKWQIDQFNWQLQQILPRNKFYQSKLGKVGIDSQSLIKNLDELSQWPLTTKSELTESSQQSLDKLSSHHTHDAASYSRLHRTSGTSGQPLLILDTVSDWNWWSSTWQHVLNAARVTSTDRVFLAFSFGPFIGFWSAHQACVDRGSMVIPGGGLTSLARLEFMRQSAATVVCCTPTYALHLLEVAKQESFPLEELSVDRIIVAGEAGGSVPSVRQRIMDGWQASVIDHSGATEVGPWGFGWPDRCGLHVIETCFIAELLPLERTVSASSTDGQIGELVLTSLGRIGAPVIRYRTGDIVRWQTCEPERSRCGFAWLPEGVIGRVDNMITVRGVNIFPSSIESIVRQLPEICEYQVIVDRHKQLDQLRLQVESTPEVCGKLEKMLALQLGLRIDVQSMQPNSLPRSDAKSRRWIDRR